jgi:nitrogen fixation protein FixH
MKRGWQWPVLIVAALTFTVGVNVVMLFAAGGDPNGTVTEPDYYRKAVEWDRAMARQSASARLGWHASATIGDAAAAGREVQVTLSDSLGVAVAGADLRVTLIHNAEASRFIEGTLVETAAGTYASALPAAHAGRWEVRVEARRGEDRYFTTLHAEAP